MLHDIEEPSALPTVLKRMPSRRVILMCTGPDSTSLQMMRNAYQTVQQIGLREHFLLLADSLDTCEKTSVSTCLWSSRTQYLPPSNSISIERYWDWRFRFYHVKKRILADLVRLNYSVIQSDTDTYWVRNPFPLLERMNSSIIVQTDAPFANAGLIYARPGSSEALRLLDDVSWRIQLFQNHPYIVKRLVSFAKPPYYGNSDDQTILNDAIQSAVLKNRTFLGSTARYEAKNSHNYNNGPVWHTTKEYKQHTDNIKNVRSRGKTKRIVFDNQRYNYLALPLSEYDSIGIAPSRVFSHTTNNLAHVYVIHYAGVRGFAGKKEYLQRNRLWHTN